MSDKFQPGQRVRHPVKGLTGTVESVQHDQGQIHAPNESYTVRWDTDPMPERIVYPDEVEALDQPTGDQPTGDQPTGDQPTEPEQTQPIKGDPAGTTPQLPPGRRYTGKGPKPPYPIPEVD